LALMNDLRSSVPPTPKLTPLLQAASSALDTAIELNSPERALLEERSAWQPGSWLIQRCWETLADLGAGAEALKVAQLAQNRHPLAPLQALHRLARHVTLPFTQRQFVQRELERWLSGLFHASSEGEELVICERLLLVAATAARVDQLPLARACLERIDQLPKAWDRILVRNELRSLLAESIAYIGVNPLTQSLLAGAIRRFDDAGAQLLHDTAVYVAELGDNATRRQLRVLQRCVEIFQYATLASLLSRRLAAITLGRAGAVDQVLAQLSMIANVQEARREAGLTALRDDAVLLRQVKRPAANADVDFQLYTLHQTISAMPVRQLSREQRIMLADHIAFLAVRSDGWTAAGAATLLLELGALKYAIEVVDRIAPNDPTRAEGMLSLVRGLLMVGEPDAATEQAERALAWARSRPDRTPERAIIWGLAEIYLEQGQPDQALRWLSMWREPIDWRHRLSRLWSQSLDDDALRLNALRLRALLQQAAATPTVSREVSTVLQLLSTWAPRLLEGEALVNFYLNDLIRPLFLAGQQTQALALLPALLRVLQTTSGSKHATQVTAASSLLAHQLRLATVEPLATPEGAHSLAQPAEQFLHELWQADAQRSIWQIVHSLDGSIPLLLALEGPTGLVALAQAIHQKQTLWA
jgi:tetratricopeptide (TPR) repeat protein